MKKVLKWIGISLGILLLLIISLPFIFKGKIVESVKEIANESVNAKIDFSEDISLSLISTFPNFHLDIQDVSVEGVDEFEGIKLFKSENIGLTVDLMSVISGDEMKVNRVELSKPDIHVIVTKEGKANYDIALPDTVTTEKVEEETESAPFALALERLSIEEANILYDDHSTNSLADIENLNFDLKGDFTESLLDVWSNLTIEALSYKDAGVYLAKNMKFNYEAEAKVDQSQGMRIDLANNSLSINDLKTSIEGYYHMVDSVKTDMDLKVDSETFTVKSLLSLVPGAYTADYADVKSDGKLKFDLYAKGKMTETVLPAFGFKLNMNEGWLQYPDLPGKIEHINIDLDAKRDEGESLNNLVIDLKKLHVNMGKNYVDLGMVLRNLMVDPNVNTWLDMNVDLSELSNYIELEETEKYTGLIESNIRAKGNVSAIETENYEDFDANGHILFKDFNIESASLVKPLSIPGGELTLSPEEVHLKDFKMLSGSSDFTANGSLFNVLPYALHEDTLHGNLGIVSERFDIADFYEETEEVQGDEAANETTEMEDETVEDPAPEIPTNLDFAAFVKMKEVIYPGYDLSNFEGRIAVTEGELRLQKLGVDIFGGNVNVTGVYQNPKEGNPLLKDMRLSLDQLDIPSLAKEFTASEKALPMLKRMQGLVSGNLSEVSMEFDEYLEPNLMTLNARGNLSTQNLEVESSKVLSKISDKVPNAKFLKEGVKDVNVSMKIKDGVISLDPFDLKMGKKTIRVKKGENKLDGTIDYKLAIPLDKSEYPQGIATKAEDLLAKNGLPGLPESIVVDALIQGEATNPKISMDFMNQLSGGNLKDEVVEKVKEEIKEVVEEKVEELKEDFTAKKEEIMKDAQNKKDALLAQAAKARDKAHSEADRVYEQTVAKEKNPLKKKAVEITARKARDKAKAKADEAYSQAEAKANEIMANAQKEADALGQ